MRKNIKWYVMGFFWWLFFIYLSRNPENLMDRTVSVVNTMVVITLPLLALQIIVDYVRGDKGDR